MAAYVKQTWVDDEVITKEKLTHIEEGIASIPAGPAGPTGPAGPAGPAGVVTPLAKIDALATSADIAAVVTAFNALLTDLKAKGLMSSK